jgi:long-chain acyl-CoA synthetase
VPDPILGEEIHAVIVLKPQAKVSGDEIINYCRERMAGFKYPRHVEFRASLPKDGTGKIAKRSLRE